MSMGGDDQPTPRSIEPGEPTLENAVFVALGVVLMLLAAFRLTQVL